MRTDIGKLKAQFDEVAAAVGNSKQDVLAKYKDDISFRNAINFVFNPYIVTGIAKKKIEKQVPGVPSTLIFSDLTDVMAYVEKNNSGSDSVIAAVQTFIRLQPISQGQFLKDIFTKDMQIGVSHKTINKIFGKNFIREHNVQLAKNYFDEEDKVKGEFAITLKLDGLRCTVFREEGTVKFISRKGLPFEGLDELVEEFMKLPEPMVYDGELLADNPQNLSSKDLFRLTTKIVKTEGKKTGVNFVMFDAIPVDEFLEGESSDHYEGRQEWIECMLEEVGDLQRISQVPCYYKGSDKSAVHSILRKVVAEGHEGLIVNTLNGTYQTKRTSNLLKVKEFHTVDLRITGYEEYKHPGNLGALVVDYKGYRVNVGSGFTATDREQFWKVREDLIGKIVEVQYFEETSNQGGGISLRFPVFIQIRDDKTEPSYF